MSPQLALEFSESLRYSSDSFVMHEGVVHITDTLVTLASERRFAVVFVSGDRGSGKTHLATYCAGVLQELSFPVRIMRGDEVSSCSKRGLPKQKAQSGESLIIDDAEAWLQNSESEGRFTALADRVLQAKGLLIMMSSLPVERLKLLPQVRSRLIAGLQLSIGLPEEKRLEAIMRAIAKQHGFRLSPAKRAFILKRVPRTVVGLTEYFNRLHQLASGRSVSTSFEVLAEAAGAWR